MATIFSPCWDSYFGRVPTPAPAAPPPVPPASVPADERATRKGCAGMPPRRPTPPVDRRPLPPEPPRRAIELAWLTWQLPPHQQEDVILNLHQTLDWRAQYCQPLDAPKTPHEYTRFGLVGEQLTPRGAITLCKTLRAEVRESVRTVEGSQSRTERNRLLAMHSVRLGQLCAELEQRGLDALEEVRCGLAVLWD